MSSPNWLASLVRRITPQQVHPLSTRWASSLLRYSTPSRASPQARPPLSAVPVGAYHELVAISSGGQVWLWADVYGLE
jgi:hypothetical protein